jgi:hypothetical protein
MESMSFDPETATDPVAPPAEPVAASVMASIDMELLTELVYQRWLDELRLERERGAAAW